MKKIRNLTIASIIIVYIVILAGGTVRMTGSGWGVQIGQNVLVT